MAARIARAALPPEAAQVPAPAWLRPEQIRLFRRTAAALLEFGGALVAAPTGAGKTWIALAAAATIGRGRAICLVPASLADQWRAAAATAYGDAVTRINHLFAEYAPSAAGALEAGARRLELMKKTVRRDIDRIHTRSAEAGERARHGMADLRQELRALDRMRRDSLRRVRRRLRKLPEEYRLLGALELRALSHGAPFPRP